MIEVANLTKFPQQKVQNLTHYWGALH